MFGRQTSNTITYIPAIEIAELYNDATDVAHVFSDYSRQPAVVECKLKLQISACPSHTSLLFFRLTIIILYM